jgi:hypothetical protein
MKGIQLKRKAGHDADFFAFDSKMEMLTTTPPTNRGPGAVGLLNSTSFQSIRFHPRRTV